MAKQGEPKCRLCRREGEKLFLKGARCSTQKCAMVKRNFPPGMHGLVRGGHSEYGVQLRAKQKAKRIYGIRERQFYNYYHQAEKKSGVAGDNLLTILESRLDNVIYRAGFAESRNAARQLVSHGHLLLNGKRVDTPALQVKLNDEIVISPHSQKSVYFKQILPALKKHQAPSWLKVSPQQLKIKIVNKLTKDQIESDVDVQAIIEFYSK